MTKLTKSKAKAKAWKAFSEYIRTRDTNALFPEGREGCCVTCNKVYNFKQLQAGHFIPGRHGAVLFNEDIVYAQCYSCNVGKHGNPREFDKFMRGMFSDEQIAEFDKLAYSTKIYETQDYLDLEAEFKNKTKQLLKEEA